MFLFGGRKDKAEEEAAQPSPLSPPSAGQASTTEEGKEGEKGGNPLLENLERTVFTFNMHNLSEMCFSHVVKKSTLAKERNLKHLAAMPPGSKLTP